MTIMAIATRTAAHIDGVLARTNPTKEVVINDDTV
jgi:hypothetical protein